MLTTLLTFLGVSGDFLTHIDEAQLALESPRAFGVGLAVLPLVAVWIWLRQRRNLPTAGPSLRLALTATRVVVLALLIVVIGGPFLRLELHSQKKPIVAVLFDHSQSMQLPAGRFELGTETARIAQSAGFSTGDSQALRAINDMSRAKLAQTVLHNGAKPWLDHLAERFDLQLWAFDRETRLLAVDPLRDRLPEPPNPGGPATNLGDAIQHVLDEAAGRPVAGVFLFSDGQNTGGSSPTDAALRCSALGTPLFTVPVGAATRSRDVAILDVTTSGQVAVGDTVRVEVVIGSQGLDQKKVKVELKDGSTLLDAKDVELRGTEQQHVELTFVAKEPGAKYLTVQAPPLPEEPEHLRSNNTDTAFVRVSEDKLKVLFIDGLPRWDFRFLKNSMRRDHGLAGRLGPAVDIVLEAEWRRLPEAQRALALPQTLDELAQYHTIILGDVSPRLLRPAWVELLAKAVSEKGVGLIVEAGPLSMPHRYSATLHNLLPVVLASGKAGQLPAGRPFRLELAPDGGVHDAMRLYDEPGKNASAWSQMQQYHWSAAIVRPAAAATVLAVNPGAVNDYGKMPIIAYHHAGAGKVLFLGTDSTWLWRQNVGDRFFYKFWGQSIRFVARRDETGRKKSWLDVRPARAQPGEQAQIEVMAFDANGAPVTAGEQVVRATGGGKSGEAVRLVAVPGSPGRYTGKYLLTNVGDYRFEYAPADGDPLEARVRVQIASDEMRQPTVNRAMMARLAEAGKGAMIELPDLDSTRDRLQGEIKEVQRRQDQSLWDNGLVLGLLIFVYSLDVGLRRLAGLS